MPTVSKWQGFSPTLAQSVYVCALADENLSTLPTKLYRIKALKPRIFLKISIADLRSAKVWRASYTPTRLELQPSVCHGNKRPGSTNKTPQDTGIGKPHCKMRCAMAIFGKRVNRYAAFVTLIQGENRRGSTAMQRMARHAFCASKSKTLGKEVNCVFYPFVVTTCTGEHYMVCSS